MSGPAKRYIKLAIKLAIVVGLFYALGQKGLISAEATSRALTQWKEMLKAVGAMLATLYLGIVRWQWLLRAQGIDLRFSRTVQLSLIGQFFNIALPGAVSGDFVKAFYIANEAPGKRAAAFGTILFDRLAGLSGLVLVSAGSLFLFDSLWGSRIANATRFILIPAFVGVVGFYAYLFLVNEAKDPLLKLLAAIERKAPKLGSVTRVYEGVRHYHSHRAAVLKVLVVSVVIHSLVGFAMLNFAHAFGDLDLPVRALYVVFPLGLLVTAVPVAPAGVGTGHFAFSYLFQLLGSMRGADIFSMFVLFNLLVGGIGGVIYLRFKSEVPRPS